MKMLQTLGEIPRPLCKMPFSPNVSKDIKPFIERGGGVLVPVQTLCDGRMTYLRAVYFFMEGIFWPCLAVIFIYMSSILDYDSPELNNETLAPLISMMKLSHDTGF